LRSTKLSEHSDLALKSPVGPTSDNMTTILVTGFGRFHGSPINPSGALAVHLAAMRRPAFADIHRVAHVFPTSYAAVDQQLPSLVKQHRPNAIVMFGLATRTKHLRLEREARNQMLVLFPDATGFVPCERMIRPQGPARLRGRAAFSRLLAAMRASGITAALSHDAGRYVCNYGYWRAIESAMQPHGPAVVVFVHVPKVLSRVRKRRVGRRRRRVPDFVDLVRAGEAIMRAVAAEARACR
jgi:pyroglutamyl-peptidase